MHCDTALNFDEDVVSTELKEKENSICQNHLEKFLLDGRGVDESDCVRRFSIDSFIFSLKRWARIKRRMINKLKVTMIKNGINV